MCGVVVVGWEPIKSRFESQQGQARQGKGREGQISPLKEKSS